MKIWLDDIRTPPSDYDHWAKVSGEVIYFLRTGKVTEISLDYDLANGDCGAKVLEYIEFYEHYFEDSYNNVIIHLHSANPAGIKRMNLILDSIERIRRDKIRRGLNNAD